MGWFRFALRRIYTRALLALDSERIYLRLLKDPHLYNARHWGDWLTMAVEYRRYDPMSELTIADVRKLMEGKGFEPYSKRRNGQGSGEQSAPALGTAQPGP